MRRRSAGPPSPAPPADPSLDDLLCFAIYSAGLAFGRLYRPLLEATDLTYVQYVVMVVLWGRDDRTVGDLCEALFLTTSTLTPVLQKLEARGLVRRTRGSDDEREVHVTLTAGGVALKDEVRALPDCVRAATGLDTDAMRDIRLTVSSLRDRLLDQASGTRPVPRARNRGSTPRPRRPRGPARARRLGAG